MIIKDFFDKINSDNRLEGVNIVVVDKLEDCEFVVKDKETGVHSFLSITVIVSNEWKILRELMIGERNPLPIYHVSRIVGYFSRIENWNPSKLGELEDRRKGNYTIPEESK